MIVTIKIAKYILRHRDMYGKLDIGHSRCSEFDPINSRYLPAEEWDADLDGYVDCQLDVT